MIQALFNTILEKLKAKEGLSTINWGYGEPLNLTTPERGQGYVTLVPLDQQNMEERSFRATELYLDIFIVLIYRSNNESNCDKWIQDKTELVWEVIKDNPSWDGVAMETHMKGFAFMPSTDGNAYLDKTFTRLQCHTQIVPTS